MKEPCKDAGIAISNFRVGAVLIFAVLTLSVFVLRAVSIRHYGSLFFVDAEAPVVIYPIWKAVHHLAIYSWPLKFPFTLALYNYLFYETYAWFFRAIGVSGAGILSWGRLLTPAFAVVGAIAQWRLVQHHLRLRGAGSALSLLFALSLWLATSIIHGYAFAMRPDFPAAALVMVSLWLVVRQPRFAFALAGVSFYLAWSFKQSMVLALAGVCLYLLLHRRWRDLSALVAVFAVLTAATLLLGTAQYRYNILAAPRIMSVFSLRWPLLIAPKTLIANAYWVAAPAVLLFARGARRKDPSVRLLCVVFAVALAGGLAAMTRIGAWDDYLFEAFAAGSTLLQIAVFAVPGRLVTALVLFACVQPAVQAATVPTGDHPHPFGTVGIATPAEYAQAVALRDRLAQMKKPIFTDALFSLPWYSNDNQAPALVIDPIFHNATRASCEDGCIEAMLRRGEIPTVMLPSVTAAAAPDGASPRPGWGARAVARLKKLLSGGQNSADLDPGARAEAIYRSSMSPEYKKVGEYPFENTMWSIYTIAPQAPHSNSSDGPSPAGGH